MNNIDNNNKVLIAILQYNAANHIEDVLERLNHSFITPFNHNVEVVIFDDASKDKGAEIAEAKLKAFNVKHKILRNPTNQGYGGNQKLAFKYAIKYNFDIITILHGDGQYPPERINDLIKPIIENKSDAIFGSRMKSLKTARKGGMPIYKMIGNRILTIIQNNLLNTNLSEFHSGFRAYNVQKLKTLPFKYNSNNFDFDTDIIIQFKDCNYKIDEISIPTKYGDEVCHVNGFQYAWQILRSTFLSRVQKFSIYYTPRFDYELTNPKYRCKTDFDSSHSYAIEKVKQNSKVIDFGCAEGLVAEKLKEKNCEVVGIDIIESENAKKNTDKFILKNLDQFSRKDIEDIDAQYIFLLDVIEHLNNPEKFLVELRAATCRYRPEIIITTGNVAFILMRFSMLLGQFNYGKRGILDMTHKRLFTKKNLRKTLNEQGYEVQKIDGIPAPFPLAMENRKIAAFLIWFNRTLIKISRGLFSFQIAVVAKPLPTLELLLEQTENNSK